MHLKNVMLLGGEIALSGTMGCKFEKKKKKEKRTSIDNDTSFFFFELVESFDTGIDNHRSVT